MREWNPDWQDIDVANVLAMRRMAMASVNWIEQWPEAYPTWREQGIYSDDWSQVYIATNEHAQRWFAVIAAACSHRPSSFLMGKAIGCGCLVRDLGWEHFDRFMHEKRRLFDRLSRPPAS